MCYYWFTKNYIVKNYKKSSNVCLKIEYKPTVKE